MAKEVGVLPPEAPQWPNSSSGGCDNYFPGDVRRLHKGRLHDDNRQQKRPIEVGYPHLKMCFLIPHMTLDIIVTLLLLNSFIQAVQRVNISSAGGAFYNNRMRVLFISYQQFSSKRGRPRVLKSI
jgi:hypothetical protein